jgi:hypothetical protein
VILDAHSRRVIGWALGRTLEAELAVDALKMAIRRGRVEPGLVHHSDRGVQYASRVYTDLLTEHGIQISMSRRGNPYDNAKAESFMKTLKYEEVYRSEYRDFEEAHKSSEVVVYVDHGVGDTNNVPFVPTFIEVGDKGYSAGGAGKVVQKPGNNILSLSADKPQASASVICNFSCNSSANSGFFDNKGKGQITVTVNSGKDGLTTVGTLERAANAFVRAYVQAKGSTDDRVKAGVRAANNVIYQDRNRRSNRGDKVEEQRVN